jgi:4-amino-4-deoxy-L-arabinose transferase-like glycosyltransferase
MFSFPVRATLIALILRLIPVLLSYDLPIGLDDMFQYDMLARSLVAGNGYRWYAEEDLSLIEQVLQMERPADYDPQGVLTSHRSPGYPAFLAAVYAIFGVGSHRFFAARLVQAVLGAMLAPLTWSLARRLGFDERASRWSAIAIAVLPLLVIYPLALASENTFFPLLTLSLVLALRARERNRTRDYALTGFVLGLAALTRSIIAGFTRIVALWAWRTAEDRRAGLRNGAALLLCFVLVTLPWAVRNTIMHGRPTWIESSLGYNLYVGYHPQSSGTFQFGISLDLIPIVDDGARNARGMEAFWSFVRADPGRVPYLMIRKAGYLWGLDKRELIYFYGNGFLGAWPTWLMALVFSLACGPLIVLAPAASIGLTCGRMDRRKVLITLLMVYYTGVHMLILAEPRFHAPLFPLIAVLAAYAFVEHPWRASTSCQRVLAILLVALLVFNWTSEAVRDWDVLSALFGPEGWNLRLPY